MVEAQTRRQIMTTLGEALSANGISTERNRKGVLFWSPRQGELGWASLRVYRSDAAALRLHICHAQANLSARIAHSLGLLERPSWSKWDSRRLATDWPHRDKIEFSFLAEEFDLVMSRWLVEMILTDEAIPPALPAFLEQRWGNTDYLWTKKAAAAVDAMAAKKDRRR